MKRVVQTLVTRGYEMDGTASIPPATLARYLEHCRWQAMTTPEYPLSKHWMRGVLRAERLEIVERVAFHVALRVETWLSRVGRTSFDFSHEMRRVSDAAVVARGNATAVNLGDSGPAPLPDAVRELVDGPPGFEVAAPPREAPAGAHVRELVVTASDQDSLGHVNHARYIDFVDDTRLLVAREGGYGDDPTASGHTSRLSVEFEREATLGDRLEVVSWQHDGGYAFVIRRGGDVLSRAWLEVQATGAAPRLQRHPSLEV